MASVWPSLVPAAFSRVPAAMPRSRPADLSPIWIRRGVSVRPCCEYFIGLLPDASMAMVVAADRDRCGGWDMKILIFGGTGFVGLNIAAALLARGHAITLFDRADLPAAAQHDFAGYREALTVVQGDITDRQAVMDVVADGYDAIVLGAAITSGPAREAADPELVMQVNLLAQLPVLVAARRSGVARIINLSSGRAYGAAGARHALLDEETACDPESLYAITKFASERVAARLAALWHFDIVSVRLSSVFGRWERATGVRDTLSPQAQISATVRRQGEAVLPRGLDLRPGCRGRRDVADRSAEAETP